MTTPATFQPGFMLIQSNRLESLREVMTAWLRAHPPNPLENEIILVQSNGIGQWLKLALATPPGEDGAGGLGIAAAVDLMLPGRFLWQVYRQILGRLPQRSAFDKAPLTWRLYRLLGDLDALTAEADHRIWLDALRSFLSTSEPDGRRRYQLAERLADLFDQYQVYRADWLADWARGKDVLLRPNGERHPVPERQRWQPLLWRRVCQECLPNAEHSRADIHRRFLDQAATLTPAQRPADLPRRISVFGLSALPQSMIEMLHALSPAVQVMLFVHNPCRHYWGDIIEGRELFRTAYRRHRARRPPDTLDDEKALHTHGHPLLAAWGKQGRDYIRLLDQFDERAQYEAAFTAKALSIDLFDSPGSDTLLHQLQDDILEARPLSERRALATCIDPDQDASVRFFIAHSPQREVEILHDQLLDAFATAEASGQPLAPRELLVMVPAIETYAPHIEAVFGRLSSTDPRFIPFSLSDQGPRQRSPLLLGFERLLKLPQTRCTVTEILDLLDIPALRARFGLEEADLPALRQWIAGANIRWGLDAEQRARGFGLPADLTQNTWRFGLERMLLGLAAGGDQAWRDIEPYDEVAGLEAERIGALAEFLEQLTQTWPTFERPRCATDWSETLASLLDTFFEPVDEADEQHLSLVREALEQWTLDCARGALGDEPLPLEAIRDPLLARLDEPSLNRRFLAGAVNFATLMPMRAVPFRQIWLLGMNDGDYPRSRRPPDFDLMAGDYRPGDRSRREDDRYLFLEALLSARERLSISWVGRNIRDNSERPPSVLVGQLRDHLAAGWRLAESDPGDHLLEALTTEHPLQPFSLRYFAVDRPRALFTHAHEWVARVSAQDAPDQPPVLTPPEFDAPIRDLDLGQFLRHPVKTFYSRRLGVHLDRDREHSRDEEPFDFDPLGRWWLDAAILDEIIRRLTPLAQPQSITAADVLQHAIARRARAGELPLPPFDQLWRAQLTERLRPPVERYLHWLSAYPNRAPTGAGLLLAENDLVLDTTSDALTRPLRINAQGERLRPILQASRLTTEKKTWRWQTLIRQWPVHLTAQHQGPTRTLLLGPDGEIELEPMSWQQAQDDLLVLMRGYRQGLSELLPLACRTAYAELSAAVDPKSADPRTVYEGGSNQGTGEQAEHPGYARFWPTYAALRADARYQDGINQLYRPLFEHISEYIDDAHQTSR